MVKPDRQPVQYARRQFLKTAAKAGALLAAPMILPASVLGRAGTVAPSERIMLGGIGIGNRGGYDLGCFLEEDDVRFIAICDVKAQRRDAVKQRADAKYGNNDCKTYRDLHELLARPDIDAVLIATGPNWHCLASVLSAKAGKDVYCEKPCTKNISQSLILAETFRRTGCIFQAGTQRRSLPNFGFAIELAQRGKLGKLQTLHAHPGGLGTSTSGWASADPEPPKEEGDWDRYLGPAAWRPFNSGLFKSAFGFEKGGGLVGGGCLEWGSHCVDLCQWANSADDTAAVEYEPKGKELLARYANGVKLIMRNDGWLPNIGSCPVKFEGDTGWVETGDNGDLYTSRPELLAGRRAKISGYPANLHIRNFLDCVKTRGMTRAGADAACWAHITCHAANIALFLGRKVTFDPKKCEFPGDEEANRLRSEALREPWRF
ncbi:MAG: Gfo/Idh/MocA family oxidoreductase [Candidatus Sumerlaeota bacterium]|nr:Gfo/Idh/MocA family oxidoreductase [Candidatus Sumerlaeota bacterium]